MRVVYWTIPVSLVIEKSVTKLTGASGRMFIIPNSGALTLTGTDALPGALPDATDCEPDDTEAALKAALATGSLVLRGNSLARRITPTAVREVWDDGRLNVGLASGRVLSLKLTGAQTMTGYQLTKGISLDFTDCAYFTQNGIAYKHNGQSWQPFTPAARAIA